MYFVLTNIAKLGYEHDSFIDKRTEIQIGEVSFPRPQSKGDMEAAQEACPLSHWAASHHIIGGCSDSGHGSHLCGF